jgi:dTDP-4-amino-4,6-dideoxygalactose transaminase
MITTSDEQLAEKALLLAGYGERGRESMADSDGRLTILEQGYHTHLDLLQAAILRVKLHHVDTWIEQRRSRAALYEALFAGVDVKTPTTPAGKTHVFRNYVVRLKDRDFARASLASEGIETALLYVPPLHLQPVYASLGYRRGSLPITEQVAEELLCLPVYPELSDEAVRRVAGVVRNSVTQPDTTTGETA